MFLTTFIFLLVSATHEGELFNPSIFSGQPAESIYRRFSPCSESGRKYGGYSIRCPVEAFHTKAAVLFNLNSSHLVVDWTVVFGTSKLDADAETVFRLASQMLRNSLSEWDERKDVYNDIIYRTFSTGNNLMAVACLQKTEDKKPVVVIYMNRPVGPDQRRPGTELGKEAKPRVPSLELDGPMLTIPQLR